MPKDHIQSVYFDGSASNISFHNPPPREDRDDPTANHAARIVFGNIKSILEAAEAAMATAKEAGMKASNSGAYGSADRDMALSAPAANAKPEAKKAWNNVVKALGGKLASLPVTKIYMDAPSKTVSLTLKDEPIIGMQRIAVLDEVEAREKRNIPEDSYKKAKNLIFPILEEELVERVSKEGRSPLNITTDGVLVGNYASRFSGFRIEIKPSGLNADKVLIKAKFNDSTAITSDAEKINRAKQVKSQIKEFLAAKKIKATDASTIDETASWGRFDSYDGNGIYIENMPLDEVVKALATPLKDKGSNLIPSIYASDEVQETIQINMGAEGKDAGHSEKAKRSKTGVAAGKA
ncbi:MAG: hypothetical protein LW823_09100 [Rickettsiales bacterium]|jgi:hypothetical protein|nr:hypothetical protein [Rickettsiales bacterium]